MNQPGRPRLMADEEQRRAVCALVSLGAGVDAAARPSSPEQPHLRFDQSD
ncbi:MAG: hypothetical protein KF847_20125 [Pirellulales bacterium]|nr:hypothetical protein [Pirellulales bacterium]